MAHEPRIVAELGRPETPDETAARRAETSRKHRANQTLLNLVVALIGSLVIVVFLVTVVVRPTPAPTADIDYAAIAAEAQGGSTEPLISPVLPEGWGANDARFQRKQQVLTWYVGFLTPSEQYIGLEQGVQANATWQAAMLDNASPTGSVTIEGVQWSVFDRRDAKDVGNYAYSLATTRGDSTVLLHGTGSDDEFAQLATSIAVQWEAQ